MVAAATFGVLLSVSRKASSPDLRESMVLAVERAYEQLQMYTPDLTSVNNPNIPSDFQYGLCGGDSSPLATGQTHMINCLLPPICDKATSSFSYTTGTDQTSVNIPFVAKYGVNGMVTDWGSASNATVRSVKFSITCNGFTL